MTLCPHCHRDFHPLGIMSHRARCKEMAMPIMHYRWARQPDRRLDLVPCGALAHVFPVLAPQPDEREAWLAIHATKALERVTCRRCKKSDVYRRARAYQEGDGAHGRQ